jgi:hypothetical protein
MSFAWRTLQHAIRILNTQGSPRERLMSACFKLIKLRARDLPAEAVDAFERVMRPVPRYPVRNLHEAIRSHVNSLDDTQIREAMGDIHRIRDALAIYQPKPEAHQTCTGSRRHMHSA